MDQRTRLCNASLMSFAFICKAASHSCPPIRSHLRCCLVSDACLCRMPSHLFVSTPAACNRMELSHAIYSLSTASPNNQPDTLSPFTTGDGQTSQKRSLVPTRWMLLSKTLLRTPQLLRRPAKSLSSLTPRIIRQMLLTRPRLLFMPPSWTVEPGQMQPLPRFP